MEDETKLYYDTCSLIELQEKAFKHPFVISSQTLIELDNIKYSQNKLDEIKYKARNISRLLNSNSDKFDVDVINKKHYDKLDEMHLPISGDNLIVSSASIYHNQIEPIKFFTVDNNCRLVASKIFNLVLYEININNEELYTGYKEINLNNDELAYFYSHLNENPFNCLVNEYLIIHTINEANSEKYKWNGNEFVRINSKPFKSRAFGTIKSYDEIQSCAFDSIVSNDITMLYGCAGSGKTTLPLSYIMQNLESGKIKKLHIIYHYETLKGAKTLGYEKGNHSDKILNTGSIGGILESKFVDFKYFMSLLGDSIEIIPTCNLRGIEFGSEDAVLVTECQNIDPYTIKTIIQRCKEGCKQFYEGDMLEQSDKLMLVSGMQKMLDIFKGYDKFGCVKLKYNYRSSICELADKI